VYTYCMYIICMFMYVRMHTVLHVFIYEYQCTEVFIAVATYIVRYIKCLL
jgi:hypothetical protein